MATIRTTRNNVSKSDAFTLEHHRARKSFTAFVVGASTTAASVKTKNISARSKQQARAHMKQQHNSPPPREPLPPLRFMAARLRPDMRYSQRTHDCTRRPATRVELVQFCAKCRDQLEQGTRCSMPTISAQARTLTRWLRCRTPSCAYAYANNDSVLYQPASIHPRAEWWRGTVGDLGTEVSWNECCDC